MIRLKTSILTLLILCIIGYGSAWAFESHAIEADEINPVTALSSEQVVDQHSADSKICDHSCHAFAHMMALCMQNSVSYNANKTAETVSFSQNLISLTLSPDRRPPRV